MLPKQMYISVNFEIQDQLYNHDPCDFLVIDTELLSDVEIRNKFIYGAERQKEIINLAESANDLFPDQCKKEFIEQYLAMK